MTGVAHPNLVCLYELIVDGGECFFTMELVKGVRYRGLRQGRRTRASVSIDRLRSVLPPTGEWSRRTAPPGKLHRDIKPSNVSGHTTRNAL